MTYFHYFFSLLLVLLLPAASLTAQNGTLVGSAKDKLTQELLVGATVTLDGTQLGATTDADGNFRIANIPAKTYNVTLRYLGYEPETRYNVVVTTGNANFLNFEVTPAASTLGEVTVVENRSVKISTIETPASIQNLVVFATIC
jgi:hypothetical protein